jgi:ribosome biogenesis GTPase
MTNYSLADLGWSDDFADGLSDGTVPVRVTSVHRGRVDALGDAGPVSLLLSGDPVAVGDWLAVADGQIAGVLPRRSLLMRKAAGEGAEGQLIAANVDTLGIVSSCNADFSVARLERYLVLCAQAGCLPLVILTKADLCDDPGAYRRAAERLSPLVTAVTLNAKDVEEARSLDPWCRGGQTLALVGMSGVGKTTLQNALTGVEAETQGIREDDARGRHTTTVRQMRRTLAGGWLIDTPGMRELGLYDAQEGIREVFADIEDLATECRFRDCAHEGEPGCAVQGAVARGALDAGRLARWRKLRAEDAIATETVAQSRARQKSRQKVYNQGRTRSRDKRR